MNNPQVTRRARSRAVCMYVGALAIVIGVGWVPAALGQAWDRVLLDEPHRGAMAAQEMQRREQMLQLQLEMLRHKAEVAEARLKEAQVRLENAPDEQTKQEAEARLQVLNAELRQIMAEFQFARGQAEAAKAQRQVALNAPPSPMPPPENPLIQTFRLRHARAGEVAELLHQVYSDALRVAVEERLNTLVVLGEAKAAPSIEELVRTIDTPPEGTEQAKPVERTLQLRVLWLVDGLPEGIGAEPDERYVSPMVVDSLHGLGLGAPKVVSQQVTTLAASHNGRTEFGFDVPVIIGAPWAQFAGAGRLSPVEDDRYRIELRIKVDDANACQMTGSLVLPLEHYVVLGTTNYITDVGNGDQSLPSAFVVYLQEASLAPR